MKRILYLILGVAALFFGITFAFQNNEQWVLKYYFGLRWEVPASIALLAALALGVLLGYLAAVRTVVRMQRQLVQARKEIHQIEKEVNNLRALPIKDVI